MPQECKNKPYIFICGIFLTTPVSEGEEYAYMNNRTSAPDRWDVGYMP